MSQNLRDLYRRWRRDYGFRTLGSAALSLAATALFALYNGYLGLAARSVWNGTICVYYLLLTGLRGYLLLAERRRRTLSPAQSRRAQRRAFAVSAAALVGLNLALVVPISLMVLLRRPVGIGLIPAIATAAYATWKITAAMINFHRCGRSPDLLVRQLRTISLIDALVSVLTLQNTLIMVNSGDGGRSMLTLTAISSAAIFLGIIALSIVNLFQGRKATNKISKRSESI